MGQYDGLDPALPRETADILDRRVVGVHARHEVFKRDGPGIGDLAADGGLYPRHIHRLVDQNSGARETTIE